MCAGAAREEKLKALTVKQKKVQGQQRKHAGTHTHTHALGGIKVLDGLEAVRKPIKKIKKEKEETSG